MQIYFCVPGRSFLFIYHSISGYRTKCVDKKQYPPAKGCNGNRLRLPSPHRESLFERCSRLLSESTGASDVPLCIPFAKWR